MDAEHNLYLAILGGRLSYGASYEGSSYLGLAGFQHSDLGKPHT
jgi:hypothetical protein